MDGRIGHPTPDDDVKWTKRGLIQHEFGIVCILQTMYITIIGQVFHIHVHIEYTTSSSNISYTIVY